MRRTALALTLLALPLTAQTAAGRWTGVWSLDTAQSRFADARNVEDDILVKADGTTVIHEVHDDGTIRDWSYKLVLDQSVPVNGHGPNVTVVIRRPTPNRMEQTWTVDGQTHSSYSELSADGNTQTFHVARTKDGKPFDQTMVFHRVHY